MKIRGGSGKFSQGVYRGDAKAPGGRKVFLNSKFFAAPSAPQKQSDIPYFNLFIAYLLTIFQKLLIHNVSLYKTVA